MAVSAVEVLDDYQDEETSQQDRREQLRERIASIVGRLQKEADDRVSKRDLIERRWLDDIRQFHGKYEDKILKDLKNADKSTIYINQTRTKTNAMEARLSDMLFPTDDRNWGIQPTPVPELTVEAEESAMRAADAKRKAAQNPEDPQMRALADQFEQESKQIQERMDEARKRSRAMEEEIADHLKECRYSIQARDVIHDACVLGTGIMKGPVIDGKMRRTWNLVQVDGTDENGQAITTQEWQLEERDDNRPSFWRVDPWNFFPDMDARTMDDCDGVFERHLMNKKEVRALAKKRDFDKDALRRLLQEEPRTSTPTYIADLRSITGAYNDSTMDRYHVFEFHGTLEASDIRDIAAIIGDTDMMQDLEDQEADPLTEMHVVMWFCQGELLKFGIHHLDSGDAIYSVFNLEKDEASIFGFGIPYLMRDSQKTLCAAWRVMLDNAGLSSGPQIVVDTESVEPYDGKWTLTPRKIWKKKKGAPPNAKVFETFNIDSNQTEMANIIELSRRFIDDETSIPVIAQGDQGSHVTQTAHGMSILMNSVNVVFRRIVKNWDDDMTTPNIRRIYDFLMQFSQKDYIKGDYEVDARGTSVLLVREMQAANLMSFLMQFSGHPLLSRYLKENGLPALRRLVQTMMIPANELIKSDDEIAEEDAIAAENPAPPDPTILELEARMNLAEIERETKLELAYLNRETEMMKLAQTMNLKLEEIEAMLTRAAMDNDHKERRMAAEAAMTERAWQQGKPTGGGKF